MYYFSRDYNFNMISQLQAPDFLQVQSPTQYPTFSKIANRKLNRTFFQTFTILRTTT